MNWQQEQEQFWRWINRPQDLQSHADDIAELLAPHSHLTQAEALSIYNNAYHQRLVDHVEKADQQAFQMHNISNGG